MLGSQKQGLQWAIEREYPKLPQTEQDKPVQFWQLRKAGGKVRTRSDWIQISLAYPFF